MVDGIDEKYEGLKGIIRGMGTVLLAFSGGVDSTFLLKVAHDELGGRVVALTGLSPIHPDWEIQDAKRIALEIGVRHLVVETNELTRRKFSQNTRRRCYHCKKELFEICRKRAKDFYLDWVADGSNYDDRKDFRPGMEAAKELAIRSPLLEAGLTKDHIRKLSKRLDLWTWAKPAFSCLSSRVPYGTEINRELLDRISKCERVLRELGFKQYRVRYHNEIARIEVYPHEMSRFYDEKTRHRVVEKFRETGFIYITLDLEGYKTGSMNEVLDA